MPSNAAVQQYLASLPPDRRAAIAAVREIILANLDEDDAEGMSHGMIGYAVPHSVYPPAIMPTRASRCPSPPWPRRRTTCRSTCSRSMPGRPT
jgi:hypothetical protein